MVLVDSVVASNLKVFPRHPHGPAWADEAKYHVVMWLVSSIGSVAATPHT
jgi:hypothetical protein